MEIEIKKSLMSKKFFLGYFQSFEHLPDTRTLLVKKIKLGVPFSTNMPQMIQNFNWMHTVHPIKVLDRNTVARFRTAIFISLNDVVGIL